MRVVFKNCLRKFGLKKVGAFFLIAHLLFIAIIILNNAIVDLIFFLVIEYFIAAIILFFDIMFCLCFIYPIEKIRLSVKNISDIDIWEYIYKPNEFLDILVNTIDEKTTSQMLMVQAEMHVLQNQINPHFLYNTLENIRSHAIVNGNDDIADMTEALATLFRYQISRPGEMSTFEDEIENVRNYLTIQNYRFGEKIEVEWIFEDEDNGLMQCQLPILTIQPIVENAIHHGLETKEGRGKLIIHAFLTKKNMHICIEDNGMGIDEELLKQLNNKLHDFNYSTNMNAFKTKNGSSGIALMNVNQRIKHYFGKKYGLNIMSVVNYGTRVEIVVPRET